MPTTTRTIGTDHVDFYREHGYAIVRAVFDSAEIAALAAEFDAMKAEGSLHPVTFRHGNVAFVIDQDPSRGP